VTLAALGWGMVPVSACRVALGLLLPTLADLDVEVEFYLHDQF
jgi:hypothetical protein